MSDSQQPTYLVSAYSEPVAIKVQGKANYLNCNSFREFIEKIVDEGRSEIIVDFESCTGMDSTFLGILAGTALQLRQKEVPGELTLCRLSERNHELICNLGLQNLLHISEDAESENLSVFEGLSDHKVSDPRNVLKAHENLTQANTENISKFQDVISFLRNQVESDKEEENR